ncbi:MAG: hypothetical protein ACLF0G_15775 [Candidatus Brocadiia bacterium]
MRSALWAAAAALLAACPAAHAGDGGVQLHKPKKKVSKPDAARWLEPQKLWYLLYVPENYDPDERYPLLVALQHRHDGARQAYQHWLPTAKEDRLFLAAPNFPRDATDQERNVVKMVVQILKDYETIDRKSVALVGLSTGARDVIQTVAHYPRGFRVAFALSPDKFPDVRDVDPSRFALVPDRTPIFVTMDKPLHEELRTVYKKNGLHRLRIKGLAVDAGAVGGEPTDKEYAYTLERLRACYPPAKRRRIAAALRKAEQEKAADQEKKKQEEKAETEAVEKPDEREPKEEKEDPDLLLLKARKLDRDDQYAEAYKAYKKLAERNPGTDYERVARDRIEELKADPRAKQAILDAEAAPECNRRLTNARNFEIAGMTEKAIAEYKAIVEEYPQSSFADTAREKLKKLQQEP